MKSLTQFVTAAFITAVLFPGCAGYQLGDVKPASYADIEKIHVPPFKNLTLEPRLSSLVTNAVLSELQSDGTYKVASRENCDAVLVGEIRRIDKRQLRAVRTDTLKSQELSLYLIIDFHLENPKTGARIGSRSGGRYGDDFEDDEEKENRRRKRDDKADGEEDLIQARQGRVVGETIQFVDSSYQVGERNAFSFAAEDLADKLVSQLANGW